MQSTKKRSPELKNSGIVFLDEIDKIAKRDGHHGGEVSREGVQRDILPIVEGSTVNTKYGQLKPTMFSLLQPALFTLRKSVISSQSFRDDSQSELNSIRFPKLTY